MECRKCDKQLFLSLALARNAAQLYSWVYGKEFDVYECPVHPGDYHLTTQRWRATQASRASKPL